MAKISALETENNPDTLDPENPESIVDGIEQRKKQRKAYTKRKKDSLETDEEKSIKYLTSKNCGRVINLPFQLMEVLTKYENFKLDPETQLELGEALSDVLKGFFPYTKEHEKYAALYTLLTVFVGTMGMKVAEWKLVTKNQEAEKAQNPKS